MFNVCKMLTCFVYVLNSIFSQILRSVNENDIVNAMFREMHGKLSKFSRRFSQKNITKSGTMAFCKLVTLSRGHIRAIAGYARGRRISSPLRWKAKHRVALFERDTHLISFDLESGRLISAFLRKPLLPLLLLRPSFYAGASAAGRGVR